MSQSEPIETCCFCNKISAAVICGKSNAICQPCAKHLINLAFTNNFSSTVYHTPPHKCTFCDMSDNRSTALFNKDGQVICLNCVVHYIGFLLRNNATYEDTRNPITAEAEHKMVLYTVINVN